MRNPIFDELIKLKLVKKINVFTLSKKTRDKKIRVLKDQKSKIIFLEKYTLNNKSFSLSHIANLLGFNSGRDFLSVHLRTRV